jgi:hypothetical protein
MKTTSHLLPSFFSTIASEHCKQFVLYDLNKLEAGEAGGSCELLGSNRGLSFTYNQLQRLNVPAYNSKSTLSQSTAHAKYQATLLSS